MSLGDVIDLTKNSAADYLANFVQVLRHPASRIHPVLKEADSALVLPPGAGRLEAGKLDARVLSFTVVSILTGYTLFFASSGVEPEAGSFLIPLATALCYWFAFIAYIQLVCLLLRGKGSFLQTVSITLELLAVTFVVGWALVLVTYPALSIAAPGTFTWVGSVIDEPHLRAPFFLLYVEIHDPLFATYLVISLGKAHGFGVLRRSALAVASILGTFGKLFLWLMFQVVE